MKNLLRSKLGEVIYDYRLSRGQTLRQLSLKSNVSISHLSEVERGLKEASSEVLASIAKGLGVPVSTILIKTGERVALFEQEFLEKELVNLKK